jgi:MFS family permease
MTSSSQLPTPEAGDAAGAAPVVVAPRRSAGPSSLRTFQSLADRGFRWFIISTFGQFWALQMQQMVMGFLAYDLTGSYAKLGLVNLVSAVPSVFLSPYGGVLADRLPKKRILQVCQSLSFCIAISLAVLLFTGLLRYEYLLMAVFLQGIWMAIMMPARQSIVPEIVSEDRLANAISLTTVAMTSMRVVAPGMGGLLASINSGWAYLAISIGWVLAVVAMFPTPNRIVPARRSNVWEGLHYTWHNRRVRYVLLTNFMIVMATFPYLNLLPGFVEDVLDSGPITLGLLSSLTGVGSVLGALVIASLPERNRGKLLLGSGILLGLAVIAFAVSRSVWLTGIIVILIGIGHAGRMALGAVLLQTYADEEYRGRVMALYMMQFSIVSFGVFGLGVLSSFIGVDWAIGTTAASLVVVAIAAWIFSPTLRELQ